MSNVCVAIAVVWHLQLDVDCRHFIIMQTHNSYRENSTGSLNYCLKVIKHSRSIAKAISQQTITKKEFWGMSLKNIWHYRVAPKMAQFFSYALTLSNINRLSKLFHCQNQKKCIIILSLKIPPHLKCVATLPCEMSSVVKAIIETKTTSVTTHF